MRSAMRNEPVQGDSQVRRLEGHTMPWAPMALFAEVEALYNQLEPKSPRLTTEFIASRFRGKRGIDWDNAEFFGGSVRKVPLYPTTCRDAKRDVIYVDCATMTHHFQFGQLAHGFSISRQRGRFVICRVGSGFDPGERYVVTKEGAAEHTVEGTPAAYGGLAYPGGPPARAHLTDRTTTVTDPGKIQKILREVSKYAAR